MKGLRFYEEFTSEKMSENMCPDCDDPIDVLGLPGGRCGECSEEYDRHTCKACEGPRDLASRQSDDGMCGDCAYLDSFEEAAS